jgi:hypothetical protein
MMSLPAMKADGDRWQCGVTTKPVCSAAIVKASSLTIEFGAVNSVTGYKSRFRQHFLPTHLVVDPFREEN